MAKNKNKEVVAEDALDLETTDTESEEVKEVEVSEDEELFTPTGKFELVLTKKTVTVYGPFGAKITDTVPATPDNVREYTKIAKSQQNSHEANLRKERELTGPTKKS